MTVALNPSDALSGVASTYYRLDGGAQQSGTASRSPPRATHTLQFWSIDNAGNAETAKTVQVKIDKTAPTISHTQSPAANAQRLEQHRRHRHLRLRRRPVRDLGLHRPADGHHRGPRTRRSPAPPPTTPATPRPTRPRSASTRLPRRSARPPTGPPNDNGWYNDDVTVTFTCGDALSGIDDLPGAEDPRRGREPGATGTATDAAGNTASAGVTGINVDKTAPTLTGAPTARRTATAGTPATSRSTGRAPTRCPASTARPGRQHGHRRGRQPVRDGVGAATRPATATNTTVAGIQIDRTAPTTTASVPDPLASGWYAGAVQVTLTGVDALSGRRHDLLQRRRRSGAGLQRRRSPSPPRARTPSPSGARTTPGTSRTRPVNSITLKIDGTPPTTTRDQPDLAGQRLVRDQRHPVRLRRHRRRVRHRRDLLHHRRRRPRRPTARRSPPTCPPAATPSPTGASTTPATSRPTGP